MITCTGVQPRCTRCLVCDPLPFVRQAYARESTYWWAENGVRHRIRQHEGGEQGDHHMPLLFSLAMHNALAGVTAQLWVNTSSRIWTTSTCWRSPTAHSYDLRSVGREVVLKCWDPTPHREDPNMEPRRSTTTKDEGVGGLTCGVVQASRFWEHQWVTLSSFVG